MTGDSPEVVQSPESVPTSADGRAERRTLLLVEDDAGDALIVQELLADAWPALEIVHVATIADAEATLAERIDCVVLDLGLPDAQGLGALARIRATAPETAVVVLTGDTDERRGIEALSAGAQDYVVKGAMRGESLARIIGFSIQRKESERAARELAVLRVQTAENARVQRGLVPHPLLEDERIAIRSAYLPGNRRQVLGGDFFDVVQTGPNCLHAVLGDVCGRGPDEAALGVQLRIAWRTLCLAEADQQTLLRILDQLTATERHADHVFATMASLRIDLETGTASIALAGHPPPVIAAAGGAQLLVDRVGGPPLGLGPELPWRIAEVELGERWTLLFYSDGMFEGRAGDRVHRLGLEGLVDMLSAREAAGALWDELPDPLIHRVEALNGGPLDDDVALLALRFDGEHR